MILLSSFDYAEYPYGGFLAGIGQAEKSEPGYGQGAAGYAKRFLAAFVVAGKGSSLPQTKIRTNFQSQTTNLNFHEKCLPPNR